MNSLSKHTNEYRFSASAGNKALLLQFDYSQFQEPKMQYFLRLFNLPILMHRKQNYVGITRKHFCCAIFHVKNIYRIRMTMTTKTTRRRRRRDDDAFGDALMIVDCCGFCSWRDALACSNRTTSMLFLLLCLAVFVFCYIIIINIYVAPRALLCVYSSLGWYDND